MGKAEVAKQGLELRRRAVNPASWSHTFCSVRERLCNSVSSSHLFQSTPPTHITGCSISLPALPYIDIIERCSKSRVVLVV